MECCHEQDCGEITEVQPELDDKGMLTGNVYYRNVQGLVGLKDKALQSRPSPDGKDHVCIFHGKVLCLFESQGT
jgi:hypothetical protein